MTRLFLRGAFALGLLATGLSASAIPARRGLTVMQQSDGRTVSVNIYGDEHKCFYVSADGYLLLPDSAGDLCFAVADGATGRIVASQAKASDPASLTDSERALLSTINKDVVLKACMSQTAAAAQSVRRAAAQAASTPSGYPTTGKQKVLVILARFSDVDFHTSDPKDAMWRMLNEKGYSDNGSTGSARDYFIDNSMGAYEPDMVVCGPVTLPNAMVYYGAPSETGGPDSCPNEMIRDACELLDAEVDFSEYDLDGDGYIDNVYLFYPGYSQADGGGVNAIWPHAGYAWSKLRAEFDGVKLDRYACSNELDLTTGKLVNIGTFCHEFSHVLGLPDLYATDYSNTAHPDRWSLMASGASNNGGKTPPSLSAYERYSLGWLEPAVMTPSESVLTLGKLASSNNAYIIPTARENEYFIVENRQKNGWDSFLPGHGMLVWHIDYDKDAWDKNYANNDEAHQRIDLVEADGSYGADSGEGDAFPGSADIRSITDNTTPGLLAWDRSPRNLGVFNIVETDKGDIEFNVFDTSSPLPVVVTADATDITPMSFRCNWEAVEGATSYILEVYRKAKSGTATVNAYVDGYRLFRTGDVRSVEVTGLKPETEYYYKVRAMGGTRIGDYSQERMVTTLEKDFRSFAPETSAATEVTGTSFTANWKPLEGALKYYVSVYEVTRGEATVMTRDFTGSIIVSDGWNASSGCTINTWYGGNSKPALSMAGDYFIQSPFVNKDVTSVKFWYRGLRGQDDVNEIRVSGYRDGAWSLIRSMQPVESSGENVEIPESEIDMPFNAVRIEYTRPYGSGTLILDDIEVSYAGSSASLLPSYDNTDAGNDLKLMVSGLRPGALYRYEVRADNGTFMSSASAPRSVRTLGESGISGVDADMATVRVDGDCFVMENASGTLSNARIYSLSGVMLFNAALQPGESAVWTMPDNGVYIVRLNDKAMKIKR